MFQESFLFADTVRENLAMGDEVDDAEIWAALEVARARTFVERLPHGLDEVIGERGVTLSGGQRQRIALARALLRRPRVLLLDDATSAVDATVERAILDGLRGSVAATTLVVAHRVSTIALADRVLLLDGGRIAAEGTHRELLAGARLRRPGPRLREGRRVSLDESVDDDLDAVVDVLTDAAPPGSHDHERRHPDKTEEEDALRDAGAIAVLRRGLAVTPELKQGLILTAVLAVATALGKLAVPILIQQILDKGVLGDDGYRPGFVAAACLGTALLTIGLYFISRATFLRLVRAAEASLLGLRVRTFRHIHRLSLADHVDQRRGALVSRVTSDVETMAQFTEWGAVAWIVDSVLIVATVGVMLLYSWQLALVAVAVFLPLAPALRYLQRRQLAAYDEVRTAVGGTLSEVSELVTGAPVVLAYGLQRRTRSPPRPCRPHAVQGADGRSQVVRRDVPPRGPLRRHVPGHGHGGRRHPGTRLGPQPRRDDRVHLPREPAAPPDRGAERDPRPDPDGHRRLAQDPRRAGHSDRRRGARRRRRTLPERRARPSTSTACGSRTGPATRCSAASTCTCRRERRSRWSARRDRARRRSPSSSAGSLTPPRASSASAASTCERWTPTSRRASIRMVPQDGFLFDTTLAENVRVGRARRHRRRAARRVHDPRAGRRGSTTCLAGSRPRSASEAPTCPWASASSSRSPVPSWAIPGLLILDEATSSVDPETEQALTEALERLSAGRTVVTIAHRLSTAERADLVIVVDAGEVVERGTHADLVAAGGVYAGLYASWLGNTRVLDHDNA